VLASVILSREKFGPPEWIGDNNQSERLQERPAARILLGVSDEIIDPRPIDLERAFQGRRVPRVHCFAVPAMD
jgi:hypothetical protein